jgi:hypothetical protein
VAVTLLPPTPKRIDCTLGAWFSKAGCFCFFLGALPGNYQAIHCFHFS